MSVIKKYLFPKLASNFSFSLAPICTILKIKRKNVIRDKNLHLNSVLRGLHIFLQRGKKFRLQPQKHSRPSLMLRSIVITKP